MLREPRIDRQRRQTIEGDAREGAEVPADETTRGGATPERASHRSTAELRGADPIRSLAFHRLGQNDRATTRTPNRFDKAFRAPSGPARVSIEVSGDTADVSIEADARDLDALAHGVPGLLGLEDVGHAQFEPPASADPRRILRDARARARSLRLVKVPWLYELLVLIVIQQRVAHADAMRSHRWLLTHLGEPYPGEPATRLFPSPLTLSRISPEVFRQADIDRERAERLRAVGRIARHLPRIAAMPLSEARATLAKVRGLGPWTIEHFLGSGLGAADAVPTGDYWYPHTVAWALAGEERADDRRMLELLEPLRPHRYRALLWLAAAHAGPVRRGPRMRRAGPPR